MKPRPSEVLAAITRPSPDANRPSPPTSDETATRGFSAALVQAAARALRRTDNVVSNGRWGPMSPDTARSNAEAVLAAVAPMLRAEGVRMAVQHVEIWKSEHDRQTGRRLRAFADRIEKGEAT